MVGIPRFDAQIGRISVPTMQNFQQEQNEQIYKAVAGIANTTAKIAEDLYSAQKIHEAEVEGGKATKETDLSKLPTPLTKAQEAYNNAAIASFYSDFSVDAERKINVSAFNNEDNPAQFLVETDAYINGIAKNIPDHLRKQVLRPIQMVRESKYDTLLKHKKERNRATSEERYKFNGYRLKENANFIRNDADLDMYLAKGLEYADGGISIGANAEEMQKFLRDYQEAGVIRYLSKYYLKEKINPQEFKKFYGNAVTGTTGIQALDIMPPDRRMDVIKKAFNDLNETENFTASKAMTLTSNREAETSFNIARNLSKQFDTDYNPAYIAGEANVNKYTTDADLTREEVYNSGYAKPQFIEAQKNIDSGKTVETIPEYRGKILEATKNGLLSADDLDELRDQNIVGDAEYVQAYAALDSFVVRNRRLPEYSQALSAIFAAYPDKYSESGDLISKNVKQQQMITRLNDFVDSREVTGPEIAEYMNISTSNTNSMVKDGSEYEQQFTQEKFYNLFGIKFSDVDTLSLQYRNKNAVNRHKMHEAVMKKYRVTSSRANAICTYWNHIWKQENK